MLDSNQMSGEVTYLWCLYKTDLSPLAPIPVTPHVLGFLFGPLHTDPFVQLSPTLLSLLKNKTVVCLTDLIKVYGLSRCVVLKPKQIKK